MRVGQCFDREATAVDNREVLIVDSDEGSIQQVCRFLADFGFRTKVVTCAVDAVVAARGSTPAIILVATQLRDAVGSELKSWLRANPALTAVPIIAMHPPWEDSRHLQAAAFDGLLRMPTTAAKLGQTLKSAGVEGI